MQIPFRRLGSQPLEFELKRDNALFSGDLILKKGNLAQLNGTITGLFFFSCKIRAETVADLVGEEARFYLSGGIFKGNEEELDVVEIDKSVIDMDDLFRSEIELILSDYHCCDNCQEEHAQPDDRIPEYSA